MADLDKLLDDDERYLAEGRDDTEALAKKENADPKPSQVSWRFFTGLALVFMGLGIQAVPNETHSWLVYIAANLIQIAVCVLFFLEFYRLRAASNKKWKTYTLAGLVFLSLAAGVTLGVFLTQYV
jgi:cation transport ATPase